MGKQPSRDKSSLSLLHHDDDQRDQIGLFLNCLGGKFSNKSSPNICEHFGPHNFRSKYDEAPFWATFANTSATFHSNIWSHWPRPKNSLEKGRKKRYLNCLFKRNKIHSS